MSQALPAGQWFGWSPAFASAGWALGGLLDRGVYSSAPFCFWETARLSRPDAEVTDDSALLAAIAHGEIQAFQTFYERYSARVTSYARQLSRDHETDEDLVQEVFVTVWRKAATYKPDRGDAAGWLYTMTRNKLVDQWRRTREKAVELDAMHSWEMPAIAAPEEHVFLSVRKALSEVAPDQREAIEMAYFGGLTYEETAVRLELPVGTLKSRIRAGLRTLRTVLEAG